MYPNHRSRRLNRLCGRICGKSASAEHCPNSSGPKGPSGGLLADFQRVHTDSSNHVSASFIYLYPGYSEDGGAKKGEVIPEHEFAAGPVCLDDENEFPPVSIQKC